MEKKEKETLYQGLHRLDDESEDEDLSNADAILRYERMEPKTTANRNRNSTPNYSRSMTSKAFGGDNHLHIHQPSMAESGANASSTSKRKRDQSFKLMAESQQLFKGLRFCRCYEVIYKCPLQLTSKSLFPQ
jgi:hemin uptake protein HemP